MQYNDLAAMRTTAGLLHKGRAVPAMVVVTLLPMTDREDVGSAGSASSASSTNSTTSDSSSTSSRHGGGQQPTGGDADDAADDGGGNIASVDHLVRMAVEQLGATSQAHAHAQTLWQRAAKRGDAESHYNLGCIYQVCVTCVNSMCAGY